VLSYSSTFEFGNRIINCVYMAKVGEGDPRWIVANREDGTNVNQWHWTESDYTLWAKNRLKELVENIVVETPTINITTGSLTLEGEVSINTRKQKTYLFYELNATLKWSGKHIPSDVEGKGSINCPYISDENDADDFEILVTMEDENSKEKSAMKDEFRKKIIPILKEKVPQMLKELREVTVQKTKLAPKDVPSAKVLDKIAPITIPTPQNTSTTSKEKKEEKYSMCLTSFTATEKFVCTPHDVYESLLIPARVKAYAGGDAIISPEKGSKFKLFGGSVEGEIVDLIPDKKIVQKWRFNTWPANHFSTVTIELEPKEGKTILKLEQTNIPEEDKERTEGGWKENFWKRIKGIFGYGPLL